MILLFYIYVIIIVLSEAAAQSVVQYSEINNTYKYMFLSIIFYMILAFSLFKSYKYKKIGIVNSICGGIGVILMILIGKIFFNEKLNYNDYIGIILIILGILIIEQKRNI
jgi:multidrug transporter EmrE-like cation transporter